MSKYIYFKYYQKGVQTITVAPVTLSMYAYRDVSDSLTIEIKNASTGDIYYKESRSMDTVGHRFSDFTKHGQDLIERYIIKHLQEVLICNIDECLSCGESLSEFDLDELDRMWWVARNHIMSDEYMKRYLLSEEKDKEEKNALAEALKSEIKI